MIESLPWQMTAAHVLEPDVMRQLEVHAVETIGMGREPKRLLHAVYLGRTVSMLERLEERRGESARYIAHWQAYRAAGLPVVPDVLLTGQDTVLLTDVKADGSEVYGKGMTRALRSPGARDRARADVDPWFMHHTQEKGLSAIKAAATVYAERATASNIMLAFDDPFELHVGPGGAWWNLICLDLSGAKVHVPADSEEYTYLRSDNKRLVGDFMGHLKDIRDRMEEFDIQPASPSTTRV